MKKISFISFMLILFVFPTQLYNHSLGELLEDFKLYKYNNPVDPVKKWRGHTGDLYEHSMWVYCAAHNLFDENSPYTKDIVLTEQEKKVFCLAALLHDIGKAGRKELFDKTHPHLSYDVKTLEDGTLSIFYNPDLEEHCTIGFENLTGNILNSTKQPSFPPRPYIMKTRENAHCDFKDLFSLLRIRKEEQKLIAILVGIHWSFGNVRRGLMTNEDYLKKLTNLAATVDYEKGIISEKTLRLAILINIADVKGLHPCCAESTCLFPGQKVNIPAVYPFYPPTPFLKFDVDPALGKDCLGLFAMENLLKSYREQKQETEIII